MTMGVFLSSGYFAITPKASSISLSWVEMPMRTWPSTCLRAALGVEGNEIQRRAFSPLARLVPFRQ